MSQSILITEQREGEAYPSQELWWADGDSSSAMFREGKMVYALVGSDDVTTISADCDKFK